MFYQWILETFPKLIGKYLFSKLSFSRSKYFLRLDYVDRNDDFFVVNIVNKSRKNIRGVKAFLTLHSQEYLYVTGRNPFELLSNDFILPIIGHNSSKKIENQQVCFTQIDRNGQYFSVLDIPSGSFRSICLGKINRRQGYLEIPSERGFSTLGGQATALLEMVKYYKASIAVESDETPRVQFPILIRPFASSKPVLAFPVNSYERKVGNTGLDVTSCTKLYDIARRCQHARISLMKSQKDLTSTGEQHNNYLANEAVLGAVLSSNVGSLVLMLLTSLKSVNKSDDLSLNNLPEIGLKMTQLMQRWNATFDGTHSTENERDTIRKEIRDQLCESNWPELVLDGIQVIHPYVYQGLDY